MKQRRKTTEGRKVGRQEDDGMKEGRKEGRTDKDLEHFEAISVNLEFLDFEFGAIRWVSFVAARALGLHLREEEMCERRKGGWKEGLTARRKEEVNGGRKEGRKEGRG